jgi:hypothetical protein
MHCGEMRRKYKQAADDTDSPKGYVCGKCTVILSWASGMNYLAAVNRVSELIKTNKIQS